ncbi:hypothetical protein [Endozoicomonas atrinae]|uniref:hypothetical protein n=1 Tax=Endozoicomonas atrinae TaxID=1333660 RepID=UPI00082496A8|nr:hypothetical protein [Endozoicomonas atrinae]
MLEIADGIIITEDDIEFSYIRALYMISKSLACSGARKAVIRKPNLLRNTVRLSGKSDVNGRLLYEP